MFIRNPSSLPFVCRRGDLPMKQGSSARYVALMTVETFNCAGARLGPSKDPLPEAVDAALNAPIWEGTSVTATGTIPPPAHGRLAQRIDLRIGGWARSLVARGPRRWRRSAAGAVEPGPIEPWEPLRMSWSEAFGGTSPVAAGLASDGLPLPAHLARHSHNPIGKGFCNEDARALGAPLPRIELLEDQVDRPSRPAVPGCFAPCSAEVTGVRLPLFDHAAGIGALKTPFCSVHAAPAYLIFPYLPVGTPIELDGMIRPVFTAVVGPRTGVQFRTSPEIRTGTRLRSVHIDADAGLAFLVWQHAIVSAGGRLPTISLVMESPS